MTCQQLRWIARTLHETAYYFGVPSGGAIRRGVFGTAVASCVACRLLKELGLPPRDVGNVLRLQRQDVSYALAVVRRDRSLQVAVSAISFEVVAWEMGVECAPW